jgi:deazaflavin-dependent oxidoreductase (nitroreductase family)
VSDDEAADATKAVNDWNTTVIAEFRANEGKVGGQFEGAPVLLLHTKGAKSGQERINPMMYLDYEGKRYIFASYAGAPTHPDWYHNLVANPDGHGRSRHRDLRGDGDARVARRARPDLPGPGRARSRTSRVRDEDDAKDPGRRVGASS